jgi:hypothetical protein
MYQREPLGRRALLRGGLRWAALAGLATVAAVLWKKQRDADPDCVNRGLCRNCSALRDCRLPLGLSHKKQEELVKSS